MSGGTPGVPLSHGRPVEKKLDGVARPIRAEYVEVIGEGAPAGKVVCAVMPLPLE